MLNLIPPDVVAPDPDSFDGIVIVSVVDVGAVATINFFIIKVRCTKIRICYCRKVI